MKTEQIEVYSTQSNLGIVRMPGRAYPGSVIQGDSLYSLFVDTMDIVEELRENPDSEGFHAALSVAERLEDRLLHYIQVCEQHGIEWKFKIERSTQEYAALRDSDS